MATIVAGPWSNVRDPSCCSKQEFYASFLSTLAQMTGNMATIQGIWSFVNAGMISDAEFYSNALNLLGTVATNQSQSAAAAAAAAAGGGFTFGKYGNVDQNLPIDGSIKTVQIYNKDSDHVFINVNWPNTALPLWAPH